MAVQLRWTNHVRALLVTCWNTNSVHGRKLELDHFFRQHHVDICLLNETHLRPGEVCRFANCIGHRADRLTEGGGTAVLCCSTLYLSRVWGMWRQLSCWPTGRWVILAVYLSPPWPLIDLDLSACLGGGVPVLMAGDLNAKHMDWNSRLITTGGRLGCNYANENSCLIYDSDTPTMLPYNSSTTPGVLDIVFTKKPSDRSVSDHVLRSGLRSLIWSTHGAHHLSRSTGSPRFQTGWAKFQVCLEDGLPSNTNLPNEVAVNMCVKKLSSAILKVLAESTPKSHVWCPASPNTESYSGWNMLEQPAKKAVENH